MKSVFFIPDNERRDVYDDIQKRWNNFFRNQYKKLCKTEPKFELHIQSGERIYTEEDFSLMHTMLEGEIFAVEDFHCSADFILNPGVKEILFKVKIWGKVNGVTVTEIERRTVYCYLYYLKVDATDFTETKKLVIGVDKSKSSLLGCFDPIAPPSCLKQKQLALGNITTTDTFDNFTKTFIFPIIRNSLVEFMLPSGDLKDETEDNPLTLHPKFGTW